MADYGRPPVAATLDLKPFKAHVSEEKLDHFKKLLDLSPIVAPTFENAASNTKYGMQRDWLVNAKRVWLNDFDWRAYENRLNSFPNFKAAVQDRWNNTIDIHFVALFSEKVDAVPIVLLHGYPYSPWMFLDMLDILRKKYSSADLPYHVIVPHLPGYGYSSGPPVDTDYDIGMAADAINNLMVGLGFGSGYLTQGGDLGSFVSRALALEYDACMGMHVTMMGIPPDVDPTGLPDGSPEKQALAKAMSFVDTESTFGLLQGQKPATVGLALGSSPLAVLSWIGEKMLAWSDVDIPLDTILGTATLYWMTETLARGIWHSRGFFNDPEEKPKLARLSLVMNPKPLHLPYVDKPCGYSHFAGDIIPVPRSWSEKSCNLVFFNQHGRGGHFAPMEKPAELLEDVEAYVRIAWPRNQM